MGAETSAQQDVIVIDSSDDDFQRRPAPPVRPRRSLALRVRAPDDEADSELKNEGDEKNVADCESKSEDTITLDTADKKRKRLTADGALKKDVHRVDLRPLLQQAKLRVRLPDGSFTWPHHLRTNVDNIESQRQDLIRFMRSATAPARGDGEEKTEETAVRSRGDAEEKTEETAVRSRGDAEEKTEETAVRSRGDGEEKTEETAVRSRGDGEEKTEETAVRSRGDAEEKTEETAVRSRGDGEEKTEETAVRSRGDAEEKTEETAVLSSGDAEEKTEETAVRSRGDAEEKTEETAVRSSGDSVNLFEDEDSSEDDASEYEEEESDDEHEAQAAAPTPTRDSDDSVFESDDGSEAHASQIRVAASRATASGGLSPARWPTSVIHLREMYNPANIQLEYAYNFGLCSCEAVCQHPTCMNASLGLFCGPNCCPYGGRCNNVPVESDRIAIATRGDSRGFTLVATKSIQEGTVIGQYLGEMVLESADGRLRPHTEGYRIVMLRRPVNAPRQRVCIDARRYGSMMRFMNHSCAPVAKFVEACNGNQHTVIAVTTQGIRAGQEITVDYGDALWFQCKCGEESCRDRDE